MTSRRLLLTALTFTLLGLLTLSGLAWAQPLTARAHELAALPWVTEDRPTVPSHAPRWAVALAMAGPLADGFSTYYALQQPNVREGNPFFYRLFGSDVKAGEILAFKIAQAALNGYTVQSLGRVDRGAAIGVAVVTVAINGFVAAKNLHTVQRAQHNIQR